MKLSEYAGIDTNILVYADDSSSPHYEIAKHCLERALKDDLKVCLSHQILSEYFSVITSTRMAGFPLSAEEAKGRVLFLNRTRRVKKVYLKRSTLKRCIEFCAEQGITGARIFDAFYATTLLDNGVRRLITQNTKDFEVFKVRGLTVESLSTK